MTYIGIDPGKSGAIAVLHENGTSTLAPFDEARYAQILEKTRKTSSACICCLERVSAMPKQGVVSMFNFGENFGYIQGLLRAYGIPFELVTPKKWKSAFGITADKNGSVIVAERLFPGVSLHRTVRCKKADDGLAEALLMAEYARRTMGG